MLTADPVFGADTCRAAAAVCDGSIASLRTPAACKHTPRALGAASASSATRAASSAQAASQRRSCTNAPPKSDAAEGDMGRRAPTWLPEGRPERPSSRRCSTCRSARQAAAPAPRAPNPPTTVADGTSPEPVDCATFTPAGPRATSASSTKACLEARRAAMKPLAPPVWTPTAPASPRPRALWASRSSTAPGTPSISCSAACTSPLQLPSEGLPSAPAPAAAGSTSQATAPQPHTCTPAASAEPLPGPPGEACAAALRAWAQATAAGSARPPQAPEPCPAHTAARASPKPGRDRTMQGASGRPGRVPPLVRAGQGSGAWGGRALPAAVAWAQAL